MSKHKSWTYTEECILIDNYVLKTINELENLLPGRNADSINCKIKRLKNNGKLTKNKDSSTIERAYKQR